MTFDSRTQQDYLVVPKDGLLQEKSPLLNNRYLMDVFENISCETKHQNIEKEKNEIFKTNETFSSSNKNENLVMETLYNMNIYKSNHFTSILNVLSKTDMNTRLRWSKEIICKLSLIHETFIGENCKISLNSIKIDPTGNLVIDIVEPKQVSIHDHFYTPPEKYFEHIADDSKATIWSAGICIYYINSLNFPWKKASVSDESYRKFVKEKSFPHKLEKSIKNALMLMLNVNNKTRQPLKEVIKKVQKQSVNRKVISKLFIILNY